MGYINDVVRISFGMKHNKTFDAGIFGQFGNGFGIKF